MLDDIRKLVATIPAAVVGLAFLPAYLDASSELRWTLIETETGDPVIDALTLVAALAVPGALAFLGMLFAELKDA